MSDLTPRRWFGYGARAMRRLSVLVSLALMMGCASSRATQRASVPTAPTCTLAMPAARVSDVVCQGPFNREVLWRAALGRAAETGPDHGALTFDVIETNEAPSWRALRARFPGPQEQPGQYAVELLLTPSQLEAGRVRAMTRTCQRAVIEGTDPAMKASCLQFLSAQQQLAQNERHHAEQLAVQRQQVEVARQRADEAAATRRLELERDVRPRSFTGPGTECRMGTDGIHTCGYNCRMGTNGRFYCASTPDGQCRMNTNGTFSCP